MNVLLLLDFVIFVVHCVVHTLYFIIRTLSLADGVHRTDFQLFKIEVSRMNSAHHQHHTKPINQWDRTRLAAIVIAPYTAIWGFQWLVNALLQYIWIWPFQDWAHIATVVPALVATLWVWVKQSSQPESSLSNFLTSLIILFFVMILGTTIWLQYIQAINLFFAPIFHTFMLSLANIVLAGWLGERSGKPFVYIGLWLFLLTIITSYLYIGFVHLVLGAFGGLSLLANSWILRLWNR